MNRLQGVALGVVVAMSMACGARIAWTQESTTAPQKPVTRGRGLILEMPPIDDVTWVTVRDPHEQAFSIQVPKGWKTYGGIFRYSSVDVRLEVDATSPDGTVNLRAGDAMVPPYQVPGPLLRPGPGAAPYASGQVFATKYGQARFGSLCTGLKLTQSRTMQPKYHPAGGGLIRVTGGEAYFTCTKDGNAMAAYVYAETQLVGPGGPPSNWTVVALGSVIAPVKEGTAAGAMLQHMGESLAMNPQWMTQQQALNAQAIQRLNANTAATIRQTQSENAREQGIMAASDAQEQNFDDVINGVAYTRNPATGKTQTVPLGTGGAKWIDGGNTVVESQMSPGASFQPLQTISR